LLSLVVVPAWAPLSVTLALVTALPKPSVTWPEMVKVCGDSVDLAVVELGIARTRSVAAIAITPGKRTLLNRTKMN
jgi:hypothetical protein